jgi:hypothetical protein
MGIATASLICLRIPSIAKHRPLVHGGVAVAAFVVCRLRRSANEAAAPVPVAGRDGKTGLSAAGFGIKPLACRLRG